MEMVVSIFYHVNEMDQPHKIAYRIGESIGVSQYCSCDETVEICGHTRLFRCAGRDLSRKDLEHPLDESPNAETFIFAKYSRHKGAN